MTTTPDTQRPVAAPAPATGRAMTLPQLFRDRVARYGDRVARRRKTGGQWVSQTWNQWAKSVEEIARGLIALGVKVDDAVAIMSQSRAEWVECDLGILSAGAVTIPLYPSLLPDQVEYILQNSDAVAIFVEDEGQLEKVLAVRERLPKVKRAILIDGRVPEKASGFCMALDDLKKEGWQVAADEVRKRIEGGDPEKIATIVYTSGTTGPPKGVPQTHANHYWAVHSIASLGDVADDDEDLLFLPLAHSFARCEEYAQIFVGSITSYAESIDKLVQNLAEVRPTMLFSVPRIYEKLYAKVQAGAQGSALKGMLVRWAIGVGREVSRCKQAGRPIPLGLALKNAIADKLVFSKVRALFGGRLKFAVSGAAPLAREIAEFLHAIGVLILEGYGLTETTPVLTINTTKAYKFGTVGKPIPGVEIKIAEDGEILARGPNVVAGYYKRDEETKAVFLEGGWFATGDIGQFDEDGFLRITDRKKDLIKTSGGKYVAPQEVERVLKADSLFTQVMVHGDRRKFCSAVVVLNKEEVEAFAREHGIAAASYADLVKNAKVRDLVAAHIEEKNKKLASYEQIKKFVISPTEWTPETGELTPTLKVKRKVVTERFEKELDALYDEKFV